MPVERFTGTVVELWAPGGVAQLTDWICAIPFEEWPQQSRLADGKLRPAMVNDPNWHGFAEASSSVISEIMERFEGARDVNPMLSVVMPGASIDAHADRQSPEWRARIHIPLMTNKKAWFFIRREDPGFDRFNLETGVAYMVNVEREHSIANFGDTPRIHLMFDVVG